MNTRFHIPSFGDEVFDLSDIGTEGTTPVSENLSIGSNSNYTYQQSNVQQEGKKHLDINGTISNNFYNVNDESRNSNTPLNNNNNSAGIRENSITNNTTRMLPVSNAAVTDSATSLQSGTEAMASGDGSGVCSTNSLVGGVAIISEPAKPLSAYALFFRDTVSAIKQENPNCSFQELSRIVSSMWDVLDPAHKNVYNKRNEMARSDYIAQMKIYRQQQLEQQQQQQLQLQLQLQQQQEQQQQQQQQQEQHQETDEIVCQQKNALLVNDLTNVTQYTDHNNIYDHTSSNNNSILLQQQQQQQHFTQNYNQQQQRSIQELQRHQNVINGESTTTTQVQYQQHHQQLHQQQSQEHQQQQQQQQQQLLTNFNVCNNNNNNNNKNTNQSNSTIPVVSSTPQGPADKEQFINDSRDSYQKCTRENCNKRAIVNPDWEDEYCSNECVIIHCRSVFSAWVESNLQAKKLQQ